MKQFISALFVVVLLNYSVSVYAQMSDGGGETAKESPKSENTEFSSYGKYEEEAEGYVPTEISKVKLVTFPFMVILTPLVLPGYYVFTEEPEFKKSFKNYWRAIHYRVPVTVDVISDESPFDLSEDLTAGNNSVAESFDKTAAIK